jgi:hypothetical protein
MICTVQQRKENKTQGFIHKWKTYKHDINCVLGLLQCVDVDEVSHV